MKHAAVSPSFKSCATPPRLLWKLVVPVMVCLIVGARLVEFTPGGQKNGQAFDGVFLCRLLSVREQSDACGAVSR